MDRTHIYTISYYIFSVAAFFRDKPPQQLFFLLSSGCIMRMLLLLIDLHGAWQTTLRCITATNCNGVWIGKCVHVERQTDLDPQLYYERNHLHNRYQGPWYNSYLVINTQIIIMFQIINVLLKYCYTAFVLFLLSQSSEVPKTK